MATYLLQCECGNSLRVDVGQAGGHVDCACGRRLEVPTLRNLRHLPQAPAETLPAASWNARKGVAAVFVIAAGLLAALALWSRLTEPKLPVFDPIAQGKFVDEGLGTLTPAQAWQFWTEEYRALADTGFAVLDTPQGPAIRVQIARQRFMQTALLIAAGVCVLLAVVVAVVGSRRAPQRGL